MYPEQSVINGSDIVSDSVMSDSVTELSAGMDSTREWGMVFSRSEAVAEVSHRETVGWHSESLIICPLLLLFVIIAIRYRTNTRYVRALLKDMSSVRERGNVFDDTVREKSFLVLLNLLWIGCAGVLLSCALGYGDVEYMGVCIGIVGVYTVVMMCGYYICGLIFTDSVHTDMWIRGFTSGQGVGSLLLFPLAMLELCYSSQTEIWVLCGLIVLIIVKIVFIWQGYRIFFSQCGSLLLFLYYLCSLEIVPLILTYVAADYVCEHLL